MFLTVLKFNLFFQIGYMAQILAMETGWIAASLASEYQAAIACIPLTVINVSISAYWVRHENKIGMLVTVVSRQTQFHLSLLTLVTDPIEPCLNCTVLV